MYNCAHVQKHTARSFKSTTISGLGRRRSRWDFDLRMSKEGAGIDDAAVRLFRKRIRRADAPALHLFRQLGEDHPRSLRAAFPGPDRRNRNSRSGLVGLDSETEGVAPRT